MPIYEYRCKQCGAQFETLVRNADDERDVACGKCGHREVERLLSAFAAGTGTGSSDLSAGGGCAPSGGFS